MSKRSETLAQLFPQVRALCGLLPDDLFGGDMRLDDPVPSCVFSSSFDPEDAYMNASNEPVARALGFLTTEPDRRYLLPYQFCRFGYRDFEALFPWITGDYDAWPYRMRALAGNDGELASTLYLCETTPTVEDCEDWADWEDIDWEVVRNLDHVIRADRLATLQRKSMDYSLQDLANCLRTAPDRWSLRESIDLIIIKAFPIGQVDAEWPNGMSWLTKVTGLADWQLGVKAGVYGRSWPPIERCKWTQMNNHGASAPRALCAEFLQPYFASLTGSERVNSTANALVLSIDGSSAFTDMLALVLNRYSHCLDYILSLNATQLWVLGSICSAILESSDLEPDASENDPVLLALLEVCRIAVGSFDYKPDGFY